MNIYTKSGDKGKTNIIGGRVYKHDLRVCAYGSIDELNSFLGDAICYIDPDLNKDIHQLLNDIQQDLFDCGSDIATKSEDVKPYIVKAEYTSKLEKAIDHYDSQTKDIEYFIIPGGCKASAKIHVCRTIARRAEREVVALLHSKEAINNDALIYINRLSDLFFTLARVLNHRAQIDDVFYVRSKKVFKNK